MININDCLPNFVRFVLEAGRVTLTVSRVISVCSTVFLGNAASKSVIAGGGEKNVNVK